MCQWHYCCWLYGVVLYGVASWGITLLFVYCFLQLLSQPEGVGEFHPLMEVENGRCIGFSTPAPCTFYHLRPPRKVMASVDRYPYIQQFHYKPLSITNIRRQTWGSQIGFREQKSPGPPNLTPDVTQWNAFGCQVKGFSLEVLTAILGKLVSDIQYFLSLLQLYLFVRYMFVFFLFVVSFAAVFIPVKWIFL